MLTLDTGHFMRCVNCWKLHPNNKSILDHWNNGECIFYCWLCGKSFHENINELNAHFENEHNIKYLEPITPKKEENLKLKPKPKPKSKILPTPSEQEHACNLCNRTFVSRQALSTHLTYHERKISKPTELSAINLERQKIGSRRTVNPVALASKIAKAITPQNNPKTNVPVVLSKNVMKNLSITVKKTVKKTVIPSKKKKVTKIARVLKKKKSKRSKKAKVPDKVLEMQNQSNIVKKPTKLPQSPAPAKSNNPMVMLSTNQPDEFQIIKAEPMDEFLEMPDTNYLPYNGMEWNQNDDSYLDTSPRLKVKNLTDLQDPKQLFSLDTQSFVQTTSHKDQLIMSNGNISGLQIQNVQSYHSHAMPSQLPTSQHQQPQSYNEYACVNGIDSNLNHSDGLQSHAMYTPNLYEMHISQAQQVQNTQLINPVFLLQQSSHGIPDHCHY